ncbi:MAG: outer membrane lipoprotein carrier protein LolA [Hyphomonadaceae bacterium]
MRHLILAGFAALALTACGQTNTAETAADQAQTPNLLGSSYRAEALATSQADEPPTQIVMIRDGAKVRMEVTAAQGQVVTIVDPAAQEAYTLMPAQRQAMRISLDTEIPTPEQAWQDAFQNGSAVLTGPCTVAGEVGSQWQIAAEGEPLKTSCVTADGILLRSTEGERTVWETTSVTRGAQDAAFFTVPADYRVLDLTQMMSGAKQMMEQMRQQAGQ